ncbi:MAG: O-antigen ligase family protein [Mariniblastus sp.]
MRQLVYLLFALSAVPIFINPSTMRLNLIDAAIGSESSFAAWESGLSIHLVALLAIVAVGWSIIVTLPKLEINLTSEAICVLVLLLSFSISMITGMLLKPGKLNVIYYCQAILPILCFFFGAHRLVDQAMVDKGVRLLVIGVSIFIPFAFLMLLRISGLNFGNLIKDIQKLSMVLPQFRNYFPFTLALSFAFVLFVGQSFRNKQLYWGAILAHVAFMIINWSRTGWVMFLVVVMFRNKKPSFGIVLLACAGTLFVLSQMGDTSDDSLFQKTVIAKRVGNVKGRQQGDGNRAHYAMEAITFIGESPIVGRMFVPERAETSGGKAFAVPKLYLPHNQFLDFGLKGGLVGMLSFVALLGISFVRANRYKPLVSHDQQLLFQAWSAILVFAALGCLTQLYFTQAFTACVMWFLLGYFSKFGHPRLAK